MLNYEQDRLMLFMSPIVLDKSLPKFQEMRDKQSDIGDTDNNILKNGFFSTPRNDDKIETITYDTLKEWVSKGEQDITDFNISLSEKMRKNIRNTSFSLSDERVIAAYGEGNPEKFTLWNTIKEYFRKKKDFENKKKIKDNFDVIGFFANVKMATEDEANKYKNRISEYISCIGYTEKTGQVALKEKLFENLVVNKYESILHAKGYDKLITEQQIVKFAKNCPKELSLDYISNYTRMIPLDVIKKKIETDKLEVFDNYVVLHYDPTGDSTAKTNEEKKKEADRAKDPILFGVISGSNKLYYICDWIDEMCDLTWGTVVDAMGQEILEKDFLKDKI